MDMDYAYPSRRELNSFLLVVSSLKKLVDRVPIYHRPRRRLPYTDAFRRPLECIMSTGWLEFDKSRLGGASEWRITARD